MHDINVPSHLRILGAQARRMHEQLVACMDAANPTASGGTEGIATACSRLMPPLESGLQALTKLVNGPLQAQMGSPDGDEAAAHHLADRLDQAWTHLLLLYKQACGLHVGLEDEYPKSLLLEGIADILQQMDEGMQTLSDMVEDPESFISSQTGRDGENIQLTLSFSLDAPEAFERLREYLSIEIPEPPTEGGKFWHVLGALALGYLLGGGASDGSDG